VASYQDIDVRLKRLEALVNFMASTIQMKAKVQSGLVDADGQPVTNIINGSMWDLFRFANKLPVALQSDEGNIVHGTE
jgi:hypothetical protein